MVALQDVEPLLEKFKELAEPLGAIMNTEKTRILTSTNHTSTIDTLLQSTQLDHRIIGQSLKHAVSKYSRTKDTDGNLTPYEVTDGLRVLGAPIGSTNFCNTFLMKAITKAKNDTHKIINGLNDLQTKLRIFSVCTVHKLTHLFASDLYTNHANGLPNNWFCWDGAFNGEFTEMINTILEHVTQTSDMPLHSQLIATMSIKQGGLGLPHPMQSAIPTAIITTKRCIQFATEGVWISDDFAPVILPPSITSLHSDWKSSNLTCFKVFNKYLADFVTICTPPPDTQQTPITNPTQRFIYNTSINRCRDLIRERTSFHIRQLLENYVSAHPELDLHHRLDAILNRHMSMALFTMSRTPYQHRIPNEVFEIMLKRKLRLRLWPLSHLTHCTCSAKLDPYGDHCLGCTDNHKTAASDCIRDAIVLIFKRILPLVQLIRHQSQVETEPTKIIKDLPKQRPFDLAFRVEHSTTEHMWRCPLSRIGFDVTLIHSNLSSSDATKDCDLLDNDEPSARLRDLGEKKKFERPRGGTNNVTGVTLTGDEAIGQIIDQNQALIPIAIGPFGEIGDLFKRFLYGTAPKSLPIISNSKPNAQRALDLAISNKIPSNVLGRAKDVWSHREHLEFFDGSYLASNPQTWAEQQLGLACVTQLGQHILRSYKNTTYKDDGDDDASIAGSIMSADTLPYELDLCQLLDTRKKNWKKTLLPKFGGNAH